MSGEGEPRAWAWVGSVYDRYVEAEERGLKTAIARLRDAQAHLEAARTAALDSAASASASAERRGEEAANEAMAALKRGESAYPEAVVGGGAVATNLALRTFAPRRSLIVAFGLAVSLRTSLSDKFGADVLAWSAWLSDAARSKAEEAGLLPPPKQA